MKERSGNPVYAQCDRGIKTGKGGLRQAGAKKAEAFRSEEAVATGAHLGSGEIWETLRNAET